MAVKIRLQRMGANKKPFFRIVAADSREARQGRIIENLGWFDPKSDQFEVKVDRVDYWLSKGAQITDTARSLVRKQRRKQAAAANAEAATSKS